MNYTMNWEDMTIIGKILVCLLICLAIVLCTPIALILGIFGFLILALEFIFHLVKEILRPIAYWIESLSK